MAVPDQTKARATARLFIETLFGDEKTSGPLGRLDSWSFKLVRPTFLSSINEENDVVPEPGRLGFFDPEGANIAWFGVGPAHGFLFLVSAYPSPPLDPAPWRGEVPVEFFRLEWTSPG